MATNKLVDAFTTKHLKPGEAICAWADGYIGEMMGSGKDRQYNGVLIVTGERVVFFKSGFFSEVIESMPLKTITSIERKTVLGHNTLRLHTSHDDLAFKSFKKEELETLVQSIEAGRSASAPAANSPEKTPDSLDMLRKLGELKDAGILTAAEFEAKKAELLARL
jgi:hypothetical protein